MSWQFYNPNPESKFVGDCEEEQENDRKMIEQLSR